MKCLRSPRVIVALAAFSIAALPLVAMAQGSAPAASGQAPTAQTAPAKAPPSSNMAKPPMSRDAMKDEVQRQLKMMADSLKMTPDQREKAKVILMDHANQLKQMRTKYAGMEKNDANKAAMKKDMESLRDATDAKMAQVLSADQMTQYKAMRDAHMAKMKEHMAGREHKEGVDDHK